MNQLRGKYALTAAKYCGVKEGSAEHKAILAIYNSIDPLPRNYKVKTSDAWCAAFASAMAAEADLLDIIPVECSCSALIAQARNAGIWVEDDSHVPQVGDLMLYDWEAAGTGDNQGAPDHVGIVLGIKGKTIYVVEGNYHNAVGVRTVPINGQYIRGYICPKFEEETIMLEVKELKKGDKNAQVKASQALMNLHLPKGEALDTDGSFGPATQTAVTTVRKTLGLPQGNTIDRALWMKLLGA